MSRKIHLLERMNRIQKIEGQVHESGLWDISAQTAQSLVGGDIYFHKKQKEVGACLEQLSRNRLFECPDD